uniref:2-oxoglutarate-dependent dioxygenase htyE-like n=1 Tax=Styela clava TaxID=7725 RepID=UPI001939874E|nr:2-oxoglutarate-dependent dioxygenase htyE-like [Styela clava]XP_039264312.1 2-oxoglutarate-dependent dioxygenase htyE-like isoform X1 [Styela clava]
MNKIAGVRIFDINDFHLFFNMANPKREFDYYEGFRIAGSAMEDESTPWPNVPKFKEKLLALADICKILEMRLLRALGSAMRLKDPEYFCKCHSLMNKKGNMTMIKIVSYPPVPTDDTLKENQFRIADHTDWTTLILLFQDQNGGLQAMNAKGEFTDVTPIPGTIIVNLGETMQKWSGGRLRATRHRVMPPRDQSNRMNTRRSIAYFGQADDNALMEEFEYEDGFGHKTSNDETDKITVKEYTDRRFMEVFP